jgi:hypothetical protein
MDPTTEGKGREMKDDSRELDWAPKKIRGLEEDLAGTDKAVVTLNQRISKLEHEVEGLCAAIFELQHTAGLSRGVVPGLKTIPVDPPIKVEAGDVVLLGGLFEDPDYSPPVGGLTKLAGVQAMKRETYERGFTAGSSRALRLAERGVRRYMDAHFSTATIEAVVKAMKATD